MPNYVIWLDYGPGEGRIAYSSVNRNLAQAREDARRMAKEERQRHGIPIKVHRVESEEKAEARTTREFGP
jgi:hypothetical protein